MGKRLIQFVLFFGLIPTAQAIEWKGMFVAGDDSIDNFDNSRIELSALFSQRGSLDAFHLSSSEKFISEKENIFPATGGNIQAAFNSLDVQSGQGCFVHMTSHGIQGQGFYLSLAGILTPNGLETLVDRACGKAPTVILISACYSGQFITENLKGSNRIILTAARADRPSFGCSADTKHTYWDGCLISELPNSDTWMSLSENVKACVSEKEAELGARPSEPQSFFGDNTKDWTILH